ncbi:MAG: ABC transporter permease [Coriobacteriales bacterium]|jgi:simple sugar transport system permease protein|nr:ABC transporter permease [Coriobacteriales bacterium]
MKQNQTRRENLLLKILRYPRTQSLLIAVLAVILSLVAVSMVILIIGKNPLTVFVSIMRGSGWLPKPNYSVGRSMLTDFLGLLDAMTPMLFAAIAVAIAFKAGLFNIGISGQMLAAGFLATVLVGYSQLDAVAAKPLVLLIGMFSGMSLATLVGWLKARFNIHEVVSTIMMNYIIQYIVSFMIKGYFIDTVSRTSLAISAESRLTLINIPIGDNLTRIPICFALAILLAIGFYLVLTGTRLGYEIRSVGLNRTAAEYSGISVKRTYLLTMALSGAAAGLAGVTFYLGYYNSISPGELTRVGFDSIAVALLANANPLACVLSALLITSLNYSSIYMSSAAGISEYIASLLIGIVLLFSACSGYFSYLVNRNRILAASDDDGGEDRANSGSGSPGGET